MPKDLISVDHISGLHCIALETVFTIILNNLTLGQFFGAIFNPIELPPRGDLSNLTSQLEDLKVVITQSEGEAAERLEALERGHKKSASGMICIKIGLPEKSILGDYFQ